MRRSSFYLAFVAMLLFAGQAALAQHGGHPGGGGMGGGMGMGSSTGNGMGNSHANDSASRSRDASSNGQSSNSSSTHGQTPSEILSRNTQLASRLSGLLPAGTDLQQAANGFKNLGQFVAAVHVSHNLGISFDQLKAAMIGPPTESLGKAIQQLKPAVNAKSESKKANKQAKQDISETEAS